jgi:hypothetical protein
VGAARGAIFAIPVSRRRGHVIIRARIAYDDSEINYRVKKYQHAGFVLKARTPERIEQLLDSYALRFRLDFLAKQPVPEKPTT